VHFNQLGGSRSRLSWLAGWLATILMAQPGSGKVRKSQVCLSLFRLCIHQVVTKMAFGSALGLSARVANQATLGESETARERERERERELQAWT
jgi:hypothetical protein